MDNLFLNHICESIDEVGEFAILFCIPYYKHYKYNYEILLGITDHLQNYDITPSDFENMILQLRFLMSSKKLGMYECWKQSTQWRERNLNREETEVVMTSTTFWMPNLDSTSLGYFLYEFGE